MKTQVNHYSLPAVQSGRTTFAPFIQYVKVRDFRAGRLSFLGNNLNHLTKLRKSGAFRLPEEVNYAADVFINSSITPQEWFTANNTRELFGNEITRAPDARLVIASNAGNAPLHDYEVNYDANTQAAEPLASKDFETKGKQMLGRRYFCVTQDPANGVDIQYVTFNENGRPGNPNLTVAVGGRPLVSDGKRSPLSEILTTSITDPRHVVQLPEMKIGAPFLPVGLRSIQQYIREGKAEEIIEKIKNGEPTLINLESERAFCNEIDAKHIVRAFSLFGYRESDYRLAQDTLYVTLRFNSYRHTFWTIKGDELLLGRTGNDLAPNRGRYDAKFYDRVLKANGATIPQLQQFLVDELGVEKAVLMGNGKDSRILISEKPHRQSEIVKSADNDIRDSITAGLLSIAV
ncbi:MAG: hypothetical protein V3T21_01810 [Candidatus Margulisiibacteriota bacterium]